MRIKIASRKSTLAQAQAYHVGALLEEHGSSVEYYFRESLGDINQADPLWKMPEKGVFTEDFHQGLQNGEWDIVVHSWKDLPTEERMGSIIAATTSREDARDILLVRKDRIQQIQSSEKISIYSSSPRRKYNISPFVQEFFPFALKEVEFKDVRGNVLTRINKYLSDDIDGFVLAKAALDRLITFSQEEGEQLKLALEKSEWMILPLSVNPTAAAQGALAIEIKEGREDLLNILREFNCEQTYSCVTEEREILASYGGGCHQKIGVSVQAKSYGSIKILRGETASGEILNQNNLRQKNKIDLSSYTAHFPSKKQDASWFERKKIAQKELAAKTFFVARANAWPTDWNSQGKIIWASGLTCWRKMAKQGHWVHGCTESLGESELPDLKFLREVPDWIKLTHDQSPKSNELKTLATYSLEGRDDMRHKPISDCSHFFWMSGTSFRRAQELFPDIKTKQHACGPGNTASYLRSQGIEPVLYIAYEDWLQEFAKL